MKKIIRFIQFAFGLLKYNIGTLLVFELLYKLTMTAVFRPVLLALFRCSMKLRGVSYLTDETFRTYMNGPSTWIFLFVILLCLAFFTLLDITCIITCLHASYRKQKIPLLALLRKGALSAVRIFKNKNWLMILYLLIIIPVTHWALVTGYISEFQLPEFIMEYIQSHTWLFILYLAFWIYIGFRSFHWIYCIHYYCLEGCDFKEARKKSWELIDGHFIKDIVTILICNGALLGAYTGIIMGGAYLISKINALLASSDLFSSLTLSGVSSLLGIVGAIYFVFCLPVVYLGISMLFYYRKASKPEPITGPYTDLQDAYRLMDTGWAKYLFKHRKRIIAISLLVVLGVNFVYGFADKKGLIDASLGKVEVTAHRGYSANYPENTIPAFKGAFEIGADVAELDVHETKDGVLVVMHDSNLKRTTGVNKEIWECTYDEIKNLDNGSWFDQQYCETKIPTLEEVLKYCRGKIQLNIELKPTGYETDFEQKVVDLIKEYHFERQCVVSSLKYDALKKVKEIDPDLETVYITSVSYGKFEVLDAVDGYSIEATMATRSFINKVHKAGKKVYVWTINSEDSMDKVLSLGVDAVITDDPVMAQTLIYKKEHSRVWDRYIDYLLKLS